MNEDGFYQLTNYKTHPTQEQFIVFFFKEKEWADFFQGLCDKEGLKYERDEDESDGETLHLFGINKNRIKLAKRINNLTYAEKRKGFIPVPWFKYFLLLLVGGAAALGLYSYMLQH